MRLWTIHPVYLDAMSLVALWRSSLLARDVIEGKDKSYGIKPPMYRFINHPDPVRAINTYIYYIWLEGRERGYKFDEKQLHMDKIDLEGRIKVPVTDGQLAFEVWNLLMGLVRKRPIRLFGYVGIECFMPNPVFKVYMGPPDPWEKIPSEILRSMPKKFNFGGLKIPIRICRDEE
jgi:hypothetical protein